MAVHRKTLTNRTVAAFLKRAMKRYGRPASIVTDGLTSYRAAMTVIGNAAELLVRQRTMVINALRTVRSSD